MLSPMNRPLRKRPAEERRGAALMVALLLVLALAGMAMSLFTLNKATHSSTERKCEEIAAFYVAEAGLNEAWAILTERSSDDLLATVYPRTLDRRSYRVQATIGRTSPALRIDRVRIRAAASEGATDTGMELMIRDVPTGRFGWGIFGDAGVLMNSNSLIDSYNSAIAPYDPRASPTSRFGNVGSNRNITLDSNLMVYGDVYAGVTGVIDDSAPGITINGETGALSEPEDMPAIVVPAIPASRALNVGGNMTLPAGDYHFPSLSIRGSLTVQGPARLVLDSAVLGSNASWTIDATNGPVEIYATGTFDLRSNSILRSITGQPRDVSINITSSNIPPSTSTIAFNSNSQFYGTIYAPYANAVIDSNFEIYGAIKAGSVTLASRSAIHYDEDLLYDPTRRPIYERLSWRRLSSAEVKALGL